jgi:hypothetical protein
MERRRFLKTIVASTATTTALAGCTSDNGGSSDGKDGEIMTEKPTRSQSSVTASRSTQTDSAGDSEGTDQTKTPTVTGSPKLVVDEKELRGEKQYGSMEYTGFVRLTNTGGATAAGPTVTIKFLDGSGSLLASTETGTMLVRVGQSWEVRASYFEEGIPESIEVGVDNGEAGDISQYENPPEIKVMEQDLSTGDSAIISAKVKNTSNTDIDVSAMAQFMKKDETIIGWGIDSAQSLSTGQTWSATVEWLGVNEQLVQKIDKYAVYYAVE